MAQTTVEPREKQPSTNGASGAAALPGRRSASTRRCVSKEPMPPTD